jgi:hypothetical protein
MLQSFPAIFMVSEYLYGGGCLFLDRLSQTGRFRTGRRKFRDEIVIMFKGPKQNESERGRQDLRIRLDRRIVEALKRESEARGGRQEHRITEEALTVYLGLKALLQKHGFAGLPESATRVGSHQKYSRIVE